MADTPKTSAPKFGIKLKFGSGSFSTSAANSPTTAAPPIDTPKPKRKYTKKAKPDAAGDDVSPAKTKASKKRPLNADDDDDDGTVGKKPKKSVTIKLGHKATAIATAESAKPQFLKLRTKSQTLKIKSKAPLGQPPQRFAGQGYDSEADDVEIDPSIEHQLVIRMLPGEDCDFLRKAIADRTIGTKEHAKDVSLHFFDKEGRKGVVTIRGNQYAATLVDLPCIIESHKSWDKKSFFKVADIHQMLIVTKQIKSQDEAKGAEPPEGVDKLNWQYPHGLTPPLHHVRQRRFRKRVSNRTIEAVEEEVKRLCKLDEDAIETTTEIIEPNAPNDSDDAEGEDDDDIAPIQQTIEMNDDEESDAEGEDEEMEQEQAEDDEDDIDLEQMINEAMQKDDIMDTAEKPTLSGMEIQASPDTMRTTETPEVLATPATPAGPSATEEESVDEEESDEDDDDEEDELDEEEKARQEEKAQMEEEIADIRSELENVDNQMKTQKNRLLKMKLEEKKTKLKRDLQLKLRNIGITVEDDDD